MAKRSTAPKPFCFVLMPFAAEFDDIYKFGIKDACEKAGAYCERVNEQIYQERILDRIYNQIAKADVIVADMSGRNPNVLYEVGYAHALGKITVMLTNSAEDIPFDLKHFPHIVYRNITQLQAGLTKQIKHYVDNPPVSAAETAFPLEIAVNGVNIAKLDAVCHAYHGTSTGTIDVLLHNASLELMQLGDFKVGIIASNAFEASGIHDGIPISEAETLWMLADTQLLPDETAHHSFKLLKPGESASERFDAYENFSPCELIDLRCKVYSMRGGTTYTFSLLCSKTP